MTTEFWKGLDRVFLVLVIMASMAIVAVPAALAFCLLWLWK